MRAFPEEEEGELDIDIGVLIQNFTLPLEARGKPSSSQSPGTSIGFSPE